MTESTHLERLLGYLQSDPDNLNLLADAANAAWQEHAPRTCLDLIARYEVLAVPPPSLRNL